jgi:hypothetical protein
MKYDNSNSGALFPTAEKGIMTGPFQFTEKEPKHVAVLELGEPGSEHTLRVHERKKDLSPGKLVAEGKVRATSTGGAANASGNPTPAARGTLSSKKHGELRVCFWLQENGKQGGTFYQVKPDSFTPRNAPAL